MPLSGYALRLWGGCATLLLLAGCVRSHKGVPQFVAPDPFAYEKVSALCKLGPLTTDASGKMNVEMTVGSDEGKCAFSVSKKGGGNYLSFGVDPAPEHGKTFLYNYNGRTYINYQPVTAYNGEDNFGVDLIPEHTSPRRHITVKVKIELVGGTGSSPAQPAKPDAKTQTKTEAKKSNVKSSRHPQKKRIMRKRTVAKKTVTKKK